MVTLYYNHIHRGNLSKHIDNIDISIHHNIISVTMIIGNNSKISASLFAPGYTLASVIANEFSEATSDLYLSALLEIGLVLLLVSIFVNIVARILIWSVTKGENAQVRLA